MCQCVTVSVLQIVCERCKARGGILRAVDTRPAGALPEYRLGADFTAVMSRIIAQRPNLRTDNFNNKRKEAAVTPVSPPRKPRTLAPLGVLCRVVLPSTPYAGVLGQGGNANRRYACRPCSIG